MNVNEPSDVVAVNARSGVGTATGQADARGHTTLRRVCIVADDFGLYAGIDSAVLELVDAGRLQAVGCMTGGRSWPTSAAALRRSNLPRVDLGLHLDLTERPLGRAPQRLGALIAQTYAGAIDRRAVRAEIARQIDGFEAALGRAPDFVDGHQHVHQLPRIRDELLDELVARYPEKSRPWLRCTSAPDSFAAALPAGLRAKAWLIALLGSEALRRRARSLDLATNSALLGIYGFDADAPRYRLLLAAWLSIAPDRALLMCHPARVAEADDPIAAARVAEYNVLAGSDLPALLAHHAIHTMPMRDILSPTELPHPPEADGGIAQSPRTHPHQTAPPRGLP